MGRFELANWEHIRSLVTDSDIPCEWQEVGNCHSYCDKTVWDAAVAAVEHLRVIDPELGKMVRIVTPVSGDPSLRLNDKRVVGAMTGTKAASLWPYKLVAWILEKLLSTHGDGAFNLQTNSPVTRLQQLDNGAWIIHTSRGMIEAKQVLLATNGYTSYLLPKFSDLIIPVRGEMSALMPPPSVSAGSGTPLAGNHSYGFLGEVKGNFGASDYLIQRPFSRNDEGEGIGGELMFGGGRQYAASLGVGISDDSDIDQPAADYLRKELNEVLRLENHGTELKASHEWSGIMGYSKDARPWIGQVPKGVGGGDGLWICAGFTGHGMPNASLSAKAVAYMMLGKDISDINLPREFNISQQRVDTARTIPEVYIADDLFDWVR
jgi:glycine/D-amino acid oxidase-like deaminating enzyme